MEIAVRIISVIASLVVFGLILGVTAWLIPSFRDVLGFMWYVIAAFWPLALLAGFFAVLAVLMGVIRIEDGK